MEDDLQEIAAVLITHGFIDAAAMAPSWVDAGFDDAEEVGEWLAARCFTADAAQRLENAGFTPAQAALRTNAGAGDYEDTIGFKLTNQDLSVSEARRIITSTFWND